MFSIPDKGEGQNDLQSNFFQEYLEILVAAIQCGDAILSGCAVTAQGSPDMTVAVAAGVVVSNGVMFSVTAGNVTVGTADGTHPRLDLIVADNAGAKQIRAGTAAANPKPPARSTNDVVLAVVYVPPTDTTISSAQIVDLRVPTGQKVFSKTLGSTATVNASTTMAKVTGLDFHVPPGTWLFDYRIRYRSDTSTTGIKYCVNHTGTVTSFVADSAVQEATTAACTGAADGDLITFGLRSGGAARAKSTSAALIQTISVDTTNADMLMHIRGLMVVTVAGNIEVYHACEVAAGTISTMLDSALVLTKAA